MPFTNPRPAAISIDFGTSHTVATIRRADGRVHQQLFDGSPQLPSAVFMDDEGGPVVGADAVHSGRRKPDRYEPNPKRRIDDASILLGETDIPVTSVIAAVLSRVARECAHTLGTLGPVTVTVPAAWGPTRRHVVADAATAAGLGDVDLVAEPVAAASYFVETLAIDIPPGSGVVVYDLGGGTFDATVLRRATTGFDVLAVDGAPDLGGLDFDQALAEHLAATFQPEDERWARLTAPETPADLRHRTAFMDEVRQAKERLSRSASTELTIPLLDADVHLTRDEVEQVCKPLVERTLRVTQGVIRESGLAKEQVAALFLVGAASRMPLVATLLHRELGIAPAAIEQPELAVSEGGLLAQHTVSTPISVPSPALPPQTAPPPAATPAAAPVPATNQTMPLPHNSAPRPPSQPTPQGLGAMPGPVTQPHMAPPVPPAHMSAPTGPYQQQPPPGKDGPWLKSKQGITALSVAAAVVVLALAALVAFQFLPTGGDTGDITADGSQTGDPGDDPSAADDEDEEGDSGSAASGDDGAFVPLSEAVLGDQTAAMDAAHVGAVTQVRTGQVDGVPVAVSAGDDKLVRVWDLETGAEIGAFRGHKDVIDHLSVFEYEGRWVAFSRDATTEAVWYLDDPENPINTRESTYDTIYWAGVRDDTPVYITDYEVKQLFTGAVLGDVTLAYGDFNVLTGIGGDLHQVGVSENSVFVSDLATGEPVGGTFDQLTIDVSAFTAGTAAGRALGVTATGDGSIQAWDLTTAEPYGTPGMELLQQVYEVGLTELDGKAVAVVRGNRGMSVFDLETGAQMGEAFAPHTGAGEVLTAAIGAVDGHPVVVIGTGDGLVEVWSL
ncbi:Hsp70 family protein [Glycomyces harbinensis]|uniref:Hsp70 protein n=1 Tax=Glycomyces harbinensis TaxID=58114 RepID=A0A1G6RPK1_9ACTN|nr:Hsp70 family protein [Glycomyces harbinensis]SDD06468.1 Hsp70 protein [Glycomyces harbinensis]